jgi:hypothetical protein
MATFARVWIIAGRHSSSHHDSSCKAWSWSTVEINWDPSWISYISYIHTIYIYSYRISSCCSFCFAMFLLLMIILATLNHDSRRGFCLRWIPWFYPIHPGDALVRERAASALGAWVEIGRQVFWGMWCRWKKFLPGVTWDSAWYRADELTFGVKFLEFDCGFLFPLTDSLQAVPDKPVSPQDSSFTVRLSITGILQLPHI